MLMSPAAATIGAVTRNVTESIVIVMVGLTIYVTVFLFGVVMLLGVRTSLGGTGLSWMIDAIWHGLAVPGAVVVISLQFFRRRTTLARGLIGAGGAVIILSSFLPWHTAFALQQYFSKESSAANAIMLAFNPQQGRFKLPAGAAAAASAGLYLPLRITGVPAATVMLLDRANVRITDLSGRMLYEGRSYLTVDGIGSMRDARLEVRQDKDGGSAADAYQRIFIPTAVYATLADQPVNLTIDYSLTLFRSDATYSIPATGGHQRLGSLGWCATKVDGGGDDVQLRCMNIRRAPSCFTAFLEHTPSGLRNPEIHLCEPDYTPSALGANLWPNVLDRKGGEIPFFDRSGLVRYPVDGTRLTEAHLLIETYEPRDHFTRHLNIPNTRLSDYSLAVSSARF
jgi:hypothetical protein